MRLDKSAGTARLETAHLQGDHPLHLVIGNTRVEAATKATVPYVMAGWEKCPEAYDAVFSRIAQLVDDGQSALEHAQAQRVGALMDANHELLARELGVSHPKLNRLVDAARQAGAYGAKLSGGGKGGIMVALVSAEAKDRVAEAISDAGGEAFMVQVGASGVRVEDDGSCGICFE